MNFKISRYLAPRSLPELWSIIRECETFPTLLAGGTDILHNTLPPPTTQPIWLDLGRIPELQGVEIRDDQIWVGACTTYTHITRSTILAKYATALVTAAHGVDSWQLRNRITLGGTLAVGRFDATILPPLYALDARIICHNGTQERIVDIDDFCSAPGQTSLQEGEIVTGFCLPCQERYSVFLKASLHSTRPNAKVSVAVSAVFQDENFRQVRIALGAVAPQVLRATVAEGLLEGQPLHLPLLERVADEARRVSRPTSDIHSSARYRKWLVGILTSRAFHQIIEQTQQEQTNRESSDANTESTTTKENTPESNETPQNETSENNEASSNNEAPESSATSESIAASDTSEASGSASNTHDSHEETIPQAPSGEGTSSEAADTPNEAKAQDMSSAPDDTTSDDQAQTDTNEPKPAPEATKE